MTALVSILIPAYKAENWIHGAVSSAVNQTWPNKEVIIVDDGSPDRTLEVARRLASPLVKVVTQENTGACGARNKALSLAQGDYIQWLDADDVLHPEKIARQMESGGGGRNSLTLLTSAWGKFFYRTSNAKFSPDSLWRDLSAVEWIMARFHDNVWMNPAVWLVSRRLTDLAGPWDDRLSKSGDDDGEYICRVVAASDGVRFVRDAVCYYRIGTVGSLNWNMETSEASLESLLLSLDLTVRHLLSMEDSERTRKAALQHLQTFSAYFYATGGHFVDRLNELAYELGGKISPPKVSWKYYPIERVFGARATRKVISNWRAAKLIARRDWDHYLHRLGR